MIPTTQAIAPDQVTQYPALSLEELARLAPLLTRVDSK